MKSNTKHHQNKNQRKNLSETTRDMRRDAPEGMFLKLIKQAKGRKVNDIRHKSLDKHILRLRI